MSRQWCKAFGILPLWSWAASAPPPGPQAFVGWTGHAFNWLGGQYIYDPSTTKFVCNIPNSGHMAFAYADNLTFNIFIPFLCGAPLAQCLQTATQPQDGSAPLVNYYYSNLTIQLSGQDYLGAYNFTVPIPNMPGTDWHIVGFSGLTRCSCNAAWDNLNTWFSDIP
jgi:hypothetical protein